MNRKQICPQLNKSRKHAKTQALINVDGSRRGRATTDNFIVAFMFSPERVQQTRQIQRTILRFGKKKNFFPSPTATHCVVRCENSIGQVVEPSRSQSTSGPNLRVRSQYPTEAQAHRHTAMARAEMCKAHQPPTHSLKRTPRRDGFQKPWTRAQRCSASEDAAMCYLTNADKRNLSSGTTEVRRDMKPHTPPYIGVATQIEVIILYSLRLKFN